MVTLGLAVLAAVGPMVPGAQADAVDGAANVLSDSGYWMARGLPPAMALFGGEQEERIGRRMLDAEIGAGLVTEGLKRLTRQSRPDDPNATDGFPSGHAAAAWAMAEGAGTEDPSLRPYTYAFAAGVTWSRVRLDRHTVWQAVAGAALGYGMARLSASERKGLFGGLFVKTPPAPAAAIPAFGPGTESISATYRQPTVTLWNAQW
jgi:membrane-associated phospholipid phosphatase